MPARLPVLINGEGGTAGKLGDKLDRLVRTAMAEAGADADIQILKADQLADAIKRAAADSPRIVVAGGDGTISSAAGIVGGTPTELGILPLGTLNHFARDLGIPDDLGEAANLAANGRARPVDIAELNGRRFINNVSIGLYPEMVDRRDAVRDRHGWPKWLATVPAAAAVMSRLNYERLRIDLGAGEREVVTPLLFVGNNDYSLDRGRLGQRSSVSDGRLSVFALARFGRPALLWFAARTLVGLADRSKDFEAIGDTAHLTVGTRGGTVEVGMDGEIERLDCPLEFKILPGALQVVAPSPEPSR